MEWLLKIVEGPMKGAEIALVAGSRIKIGSGDDGDIVIADQSMPPVACELDVSESSVTRIETNGEAAELEPFAVVEYGATAFAIGPAEGAWRELKKAKGRGEGEGVGEGGREAGRARSTSAPQPGDAATADGGDSAATSSKSPYRRVVLACCCLIIVLLAAAVAAWRFWPRISGKWTRETAPATVCTNAISLADIARDHNLTLTNCQSSIINCQLLKGNLKRRTERLAIRALALAADPTVKFDLTDDESLCASANELLFVVTEGKLKATGATNRVVTIAGYAPTAASLERSVRALNADVPGIERLITTGVQVGGVPPKAKDSVIANTVFEEEAPERAPGRVAVKKPQSRNYPIAGVLTKPYPCVVLRNGMRLTEGAQIENVVIEKIDVDGLVLKEGNTCIEWKPW